MKWIKYGLAIIVCVICIIGTMKFIKGNTSHDVSNENTLASSQPVLTIESTDTKNGINQTLSKEKVWQKIANSYIDGESINESEDTVLQDDWQYHINSVKVTKEHNKNWDAVPDYTQYQYDTDYNLTNEYSYLSLNITIKCQSLNELGSDFWLNSMWLNIFDNTAEQVVSDYAEMATASLGKPKIQSYFHNPLKEGETLTTDIVYIVPDDIINNKGLYYILLIDNRNAKPMDPDDIGLIKIPFGVEG